MSYLFPINVDLSEKKCLVVGGGKVAERKAANLMECGASIVVISPQAEDRIQQWHETGAVTWRHREFNRADLQGVFLVFVATNDNALNENIARLCRQQAILVNVVDDPDNCDFFVPSVLRRESLVISISTEGKSPMLAKRLREELENIVGEEYGQFVQLLGEQRQIVKQTVPDIETRKKIFEALVYSDILDLLRAGDEGAIRERVKQCMSFWPD